MRYVPMEERFWAKVQKTSGCWLWTASTTSDGYGRLRAERGENRKVLAHRLSYELHHGPFDPNLFVLHTCDTPACVRPDHLFLGDQYDNMRDMAAKGRGNAGLTQCRRGHDFTPDNTGFDARTGKRFCRACDRVSSKKSNDKRRKVTSA